mgnify:CR=1 FL=1
MTGYGCGEAATPTGKVVVEIKAVNHRFSDVVVKLPRTYSCFEDLLRRLIQAVSTRGRVEVYLTVDESLSKNFTVKVDKELAMAYYKALEDLRLFLGLESPVSMEHVLTQHGILSLIETRCETDEMGQYIEAAAEIALQEFVRTREAEGKNLAEDIRKRLKRVKEICRLIQEEAPQVTQAYRERISERLQEYVDKFDQARLVTEIVLLAERVDITEELVRIDSHVTRAEEILDGEEPAGRHLDFLLQEIFREVNTIGAKAQNLHISQLVVEAKVELEKLREQVQNLE